MRTRKRSLSLLLCGALLFSLCPQTASAVSIPKTGAESSGLCEHHPEHDEACGYAEETAEIPCSHEHTEECYSLITRCVHAHTAECYPAESVSDNTPPRPMRKIGGR